jgi:UDP-glucose 4-epimerase
MTGETRPPAPRVQGHRVLVTGGGGFIGASLAERLVEDNEVVLFDHDFGGSAALLSRAWHHANLSVVKGDVLDAGALATACDGADVVVHLAAIVGVRNVLAQGRRTIDVNFTGTSNLLRAIEARRDLTRLVYFSTSEVFGMRSFQATEESPTSIGPVGEARWTYSIAKLAGEHLVHCFHRELGIPTVTIRPFNIFGPLRLGDHAMLRFIVAALRGRDLVIHGDGTQIRSWCYVDDLVDALLRAIVLPRAVGETFNIGNPRNTLTIYELARQVIELLGSSSRIRFEAIDFSDIDVRVPRLKKAEQLLGFRPAWELDAALRRTATWYRSHLDHVDPALTGVPLMPASPTGHTGR